MSSLMKRLIAAKFAAKAAPPRPAIAAVAAPPVTRPRGSCKAINPETGRQCALLNGHTSSHRHGRTEFRFSAEPGQTSFRRRDALDALAAGRHTNPFTTGEHS